jgi:5-methylcytosine-specific restriction endonuclease McrA
VVQSVLLLNTTYQPLRLIAMSRALTLLFAGKADIVETHAGRPLVSVNHVLPRPSVIVLKHFVHVPQRHATWSRRGVLIRDHYTCQYCGTVMNHREATIDHVVPQWKCKRTGQPANTWTNTVASCTACQSRKGGRAIHEAGMHFINPDFEPKIPRTSYLVLTSDILPEWKQYIQV